MDSSHDGHRPGNGLVNYTVDVNTNAIVRHDDCPDQTYTVTQAGCTYALSSSSASFPTMGGTNTVNVITTSPCPCPWTATPNNEWLTILRGASGVGSGTVTYVVALNGLNNTPRTGTISIAGQTFTVTQAKNSPPSVNAGADQVVTFPVIASLSGTATDDGMPFGTLTPTWSEVGGPGTVSFGSPNALSTTARFSTNGAYVLRLTVSMVCSARMTMCGWRPTRDRGS